MNVAENLTGEILDASVTMRDLCLPERKSAAWKCHDIASRYQPQQSYWYMYIKKAMLL